MHIGKLYILIVYLNKTVTLLLCKYKCVMAVEADNQMASAMKCKTVAKAVIGNRSGGGRG